MAKSSATRNAVDSVVREYGRLAPDYDRRWSFYLEATLRETRKRIELHSGQSLLDVGCGTGTFLAALSKSGPNARLFGVDPTPGMLKVARTRIGDAPVLVQSDAEWLPFPEQTFNVVVSMSAFHYFRNSVGALEEMARVLRPGGRVGITNWCRDYFVYRISEPLIRAFHRVSFRTYRREQLCRLLGQAGFSDIRIDRYKINWFWDLMTAVAHGPMT